MKIRAKQRLLAALLVGAFALPALAQFTRDASAKKKIDEAINKHYLMMKLDKAEGLLTGTVDACKDKCSPATKAKAWMYVGIVRGSGKSDQAGAQEAFAKAKGLDPNVQLDADLASPETKETFDSTPGSSTPPEPAADEEKFEEPAPESSGRAAPGAAPPPPGVPGDMLCSPQGAPIGLNMPIPVSCTSDADVASGFVKFQEPGSSEWKKVNLVDNNGQWEAEIPCTYNKTEGEFKFYVGVKNDAGEYVDQFGSKKKSASFEVEDGGAAPAFPGQPQVASCTESKPSDDCPPDFPGCGSSAESATCGDLDWGAACSNSGQCKCGLLCEEGQCATAPSCTADTDCETGTCVDGACSVTSGGESDSAPSGPFKRHWLTLAAGADAMILGGGDLGRIISTGDPDSLCGQSAGYQESYGIQCYNAETGDRVFVNDTAINPAAFTMGQIRIKVGYDYALTENIKAGARVGFAFLNTHPQAEDENAFTPLHAAARFSYTFTSLANAGLRPSLYAAGGFAESNGKVRYSSSLLGADVDVYKVAGQIFAAPGGSLGYALSPNLTINADVQFMLLFGGPFSQALHSGISMEYGL